MSAHIAIAQQGDGEKFRLRLSPGYAREDFHWSIAGNSDGQAPNIYSELKWKAVSGPSLTADLQWKVWGRWRLFVTGSHVFTHSGSMTDTDYGLNNRNDPVYHQQFKLTGGYNNAGRIGVGYCLLNKGPLQLTSFIGYGIDLQYFPIKDPDGPFALLNSNYSTKWLGPLIRMELCWHWTDRWQITADMSYHQADYHAKADWNLISTFAHPVSFRHTAKGYGVEAAASIQYRIYSHIALDLKGQYFNWQTGTGIDQLYLSAGGSDQTQLNGVVREGWGIGVGVEIGIF